MATNITESLLSRPVFTTSSDVVSVLSDSLIVKKIGSVMGSISQGIYNSIFYDLHPYFKPCTHRYSYAHTLEFALKLTLVPIRIITNFHYVTKYVPIILLLFITLCHNLDCLLTPLAVTIGRFAFAPLVGDALVLATSIFDLGIAIKETYTCYKVYTLAKKALKSEGSARQALTTFKSEFYDVSTGNHTPEEIQTIQNLKTKKLEPVLGGKPLHNIIQRMEEMHIHNTTDAASLHELFKEVKNRSYRYLSIHAVEIAILLIYVVTGIALLASISLSGPGFLALFVCLTVVYFALPCLKSFLDSYKKEDLLPKPIDAS